MGRTILSPSLEMSNHTPLSAGRVFGHYGLVDSAAVYQESSVNFLIRNS